MDKDKYVPGLMAKAGGSFFRGMTTKDPNQQSGIILIFLSSLTALLLVVGTEPLKVLMRRKIGFYTLGIASIVIAAIVYGFWAWFLFYISAKAIEDSFEHSLLLAGSVLYALLAVSILVFMVMEIFDKSEEGKDDYFRGNSIFFEFLLNKGIKYQTIWIFIEPGACILIGSLLTILNLFVGLPFLITAISFFINEWYHVSRLPQSQKDKIASMQAESQSFPNSEKSDKEFYVVKRYNE